MQVLTKTFATFLITIETIGLGGKSSISAREIVRTVALSDESAPGILGDAHFTRFLYPTINNRGRTAFYAALGGGDVTFQNNEAVYSEKSGSGLELIARSGEVDLGDVGGLANGWGLFSNVLLNERGSVSFLTSLRGFDSRRSAIAVISGASEIRLIPAFGFDGPRLGGDLGQVAVGNQFVMNNSDEIAFLGGLGSVGLEAVYRADESTALSLLGSEHGDAHLNGGLKFAGFSDPVINNAGHTAFVAEVFGPGVDRENNEVIVVSPKFDSLRIAVRKGDAVPDLGLSVALGRLSYPKLNDLGQTAFAAELTGDGVHEQNNQALFFEDGTGRFTVVARKGDRAPGTASDVAFDSFMEFGISQGVDRRFSHVALNANGEMAFLSRLMGPGVDETNDRAIFSLHSDGRIALVAREGEFVPGTNGDAVFDTLSVPTMNAKGQVAFSAELVDATEESEPYRAILATDVLQNLKLIAQAGDSIDVSRDPLAPDIRSISTHRLGFNVHGANGSGVGGGFNDFGQLAFMAMFSTSDGHGIQPGIFVSTLVAVPEPAAEGILITCVVVAFGCIRIQR